MTERTKKDNREENKEWQRGRQMITDRMNKNNKKDKDMIENKYEKK